VILQADTADERILRRGVARRESGDVEVWNELADIGEIGDALPFEGLRRECADGHGHVIDALRSLLRRDDDGFEHRVVLFLGLGQSGWGHSERAERRGECHGRKIPLVHSNPP
jgi:hypothetical protein